jgi:ribonuclease P protein component
VLPKKYRLPKDRFQTLYKQGVKNRAKYGMVIALKDSNLKNPLLGIVVSKKIGNAVKRHRMTRLIRNVFLNTLKENPKIENAPYYIEYIAFEFCDEYSVLEEELQKQIITTLSK